jgi:endoglucanase
VRIVCPQSLLAAAALGLASCGGGGTPTPSPTPAPSPAPSPAPAPSPTGTPVPSALTQADARIGECMNMGNMLEAPNEGDWGRAIVDSDFADIKARSFETVRLPVRFSNHALTVSPYTIDAAFMDRVEHVVDTARAAGLRVILDLHHYEDPQGDVFADPSGQKARFTALWRQIATRFKDKDGQVWFELLNEPHGSLNDANLRGVLQPALDAVRQSNPTRPVVIGGQNYSGIDSLATLDLPNDAYLVVTFHYYDPFAFTHQGAPWISPVLPTGRIFPSGTDLADLDASVQKAKAFMAATKRPLFLGEYGAYEGIAVADRATWYKAVHDGFEDANVDGCVWAYTNTMYFRDPGTNGWIGQLLTAIGL